MTIVFIGDIHQHWRRVEAGLAALRTLPKAAILLGDIMCDRPLGSAGGAVAEARHRGSLDPLAITAHDGGPEMWANLNAPERNELTAAGALHAKVQTIHGIRIAGLGGTFRPRIW